MHHVAMLLSLLCVAKEGVFSPTVELRKLDVHRNGVVRVTLQGEVRADGQIVFASGGYRHRLRDTLVIKRLGGESLSVRGFAYLTTDSFDATPSSLPIGRHSLLDLLEKSIGQPVKLKIGDREYSGIVQGVENEDVNASTSKVARRSFVFLRDEQAAVQRVEISDDNVILSLVNQSVNELYQLALENAGLADLTKGGMVAVRVANVKDGEKIEVRCDTLFDIEPKLDVIIDLDGNQATIKRGWIHVMNTTPYDWRDIELVWQDGNSEAGTLSVSPVRSIYLGRGENAEIPVEINSGAAVTTREGEMWVYNVASKELLLRNEFEGNGVDLLAKRNVTIAVGTDKDAIGNGMMVPTAMSKGVVDIIVDAPPMKVKETVTYAIATFGREEMTLCERRCYEVDGKKPELKVIYVNPSKSWEAGSEGCFIEKVPSVRLDLLLPNLSMLSKYLEKIPFADSNRHRLVRLIEIHRRLMILAADGDRYSSHEEEIAHLRRELAGILGS